MSVTAEITRPAANVDRIVPIDAARGFAMLCSCLVHFAWWLDPVYPHTESLLVSLGMLATPTFLLLSGAMVGMLFSTQPAKNRGLFLLLVDRGLFILTVGHFAIALAELHKHGRGLANSLEATFVTDAIALAMILAAFLIKPLRRSGKSVALWALFAFTMGWILALTWHPESDSIEALKQLLVGRMENDRVIVGYTSPLLQYIAVYVIGLSLGKLLAGAIKGDGWEKNVGKRCMTWGLTMVVAAVGLRLIWALVDSESGPWHFHSLDLTLSPGQKIPPSPGYLIMYSGCGLVVTGVMFALWKHASARGLVRWFAVIGQASLFIFVIQYFLLWTVPDLLGYTPGPDSFLEFIADVAAIWCLARIWVALKGNRWLTVGLRRAVRRPELHHTQTAKTVV